MTSDWTLELDGKGECFIHWNPFTELEELGTKGNDCRSSIIWCLSTTLKIYFSTDIVRIMSRTVSYASYSQAFCGKEGEEVSSNGKRKSRCQVL